MKKISSHSLHLRCINVPFALRLRSAQKSKLHVHNIISNLQAWSFKLLCCTLSLILLLAACRKDKEAGINKKVVDNGAISGTISPVGKVIEIQAHTTEHFVYSGIPDATGTFKISDVPSGTYTIYIVPALGFNRSSGLPITVTAGHDTKMGALLVYPASGPDRLNSLSYFVDGNPGALTTTYSCTYDGLNLAVSAQSTQLRQNNSSLLVRVVTNQLDIFLENVNGVGTYNCKGTSSCAIKLSNRLTSPFGVSPLYSWSTNNTGGSGIVQITGIDPVNRTIAGTFTATVVPESSSGATGTRVITNGVFTNVAY